MMDLNYEMLRIRMIEEEIARRYPEGKMRCPVHLSVGQEAAAVGVCAGLNKEDRMVSTHRSHAHYLAKGGSLKGLIGELYGKSSGCSRGNGGSMHLIDLSVNFFGSTSIVGGTIPVGVGIAFADKLKGLNHTTVVCIGDGALEEGVFHESANFASLHNLNVLFLVENNEFSCYTHLDKRQPAREWLTIARAHKLTFYRAADFVNKIQFTVDRAVRRPGPKLLLINNWRTLEHCGPNNDDHLGYRQKRDQEAIWPLPGNSVERIKAEIDEAFEHAENALPPDEKEVGAYVFA